MKFVIATLFLLCITAYSATNAQQPDMQALMGAIQCSSNCVEEQNQCHIKLEPSCKQAKDKSACYEECNAAYATCLGGCNPPSPNVFSDSAAQ